MERFSNLNIEQLIEFLISNALANKHSYFSSLENINEAKEHLRLLLPNILEILDGLVGDDTSLQKEMWETLSIIKLLPIMDDYNG